VIPDRVQVCLDETSKQLITKTRVPIPMKAGRAVGCRVADKQALIHKITASQHDRNTHHSKSDWHFTSKEARTELKHLYPSI
jgi:hypothetical protein